MALDTLCVWKHIYFAIKDPSCPGCYAAVRPYCSCPKSQWFRLVTLANLDRFEGEKFHRKVLFWLRPTWKTKHVLKPSWPKFNYKGCTR